MLAFRRGNPHRLRAGGASCFSPLERILARAFDLWHNHIMRLTATIQLRPTPEQADALKRTLETANVACDYISQVAFSAQTFRQFPIHRLTYTAVRETFSLAAQLVVRCIAKVADAYKLDRKVQRTFQPHGAVPFDARILSYNLKGSEVSIWTLDGRQVIRFVCGERQRELLVTQRGETDLALVRG